MSGGPVVKNLPASAGDLGLIPGLGGFHMLQGNQARAPNSGAHRAQTRSPRLPTPEASADSTACAPPPLSLLTATAEAHAP